MKSCLIITLIFAFFPLCAQKHDYTWIIGDDNTPGITNHGGMLINFNHLPVNAEFHLRQLDMFLCNVSMSDSLGNLLFYSNGCAIAGKDDEILPNGNDINPGPIHQIDCIQNDGGYASNHQSAVVLPFPEHVDIYYLFHHHQTITYNPTSIFTDQLLYSVVDMNAHFKNREVTQKNVLVIQDTLSYGEMNAVKHANGKDWWIIVPRRNSNQFYSILLTKDGVSNTILQKIGPLPPSNQEGRGQTVFNPSGTQMVRYYPETPIMVYDFDRSTGGLSNLKTFLLDTGNSIDFQGGCSFSPSGQYFYVAAATQVYQFDMLAPDISASQTTVATWDGFVDPVAILFWYCQLGPDCKIYILGGGDTRYYHIIHNPDEPGLACNVEQRGLVLPTPSGASIPYFPNYRLGPIDNPGLPCSPVVATQQPAIRVPACEVWPNPAVEQLHFSLPEGQIRRITLTDTYGRAAREVRPGAPSGAYTLPVGDLPAGVYFWTVEGESGVLGGRPHVGKIVLGR